MLYLDIALRGAAIALLVLLAALLWRAPIGWAGRASVIGVAITKTAFLLVFSPISPEFPPALLANLNLVPSLTPLALTALLVTIFVDTPGQRWPWLAAAGLAALTFYLHLTFENLVFGLLCLPLAVALYGGLFALSLWNARSDLVDCRCRARPGFAMAIAGLALLMTGLQAVGVLTAASATLQLMQASGVTIVALSFALWILRADNDLWPGVSDITTTPAQQPKPNEPTQDTAPDQALIGRIETAMAEGAWREEGLTIGALSAQLAVPEHRVRRAINGGLGHRNFSSYVNHHRIAEACRQLSDPTLMGKTVLEIAYDVGFASLGPFNRAFRAETGQSPTEFRRNPPLREPVDSDNVTSISVKVH